VHFADLEGHQNPRHANAAWLLTGLAFIS